MALDAALDAAFDVRDVSKTYGRRAALDHVTLKIAPGEMVALIGPSGSGKSTLLRALTGLTRIDAGHGQVRTLGAVVQERGRLSGDIRRLRARVGFIFQQFNLVGRLSLYTNVAVGALARVGGLRGLLGLWPVAEQQAAMAALARVGVADYAGQRANTLSGGQQQRGAIARALVQRAEAVLADEPVASLDPVSARKVMELLAELNAKDGLTVVVTLHQVEFALRYCRRVVALQGGKVAYDGPADGLTHARLVDIYGPEIDDVLPEGAAP
jgi:phosphonate transport system ATP-binding protein